MKGYFAPLEGITGYVFRNAHRAVYGGPDAYFSPFLSPTPIHRFTSREKNDILPEHNEGIFLIPQLLTNHGDDCLWACQELSRYGYGEINLNMGCPSGTVVSKKRGAGFLAETEAMDRFFDRLFEGLEGPDFGGGRMKISVKTRIGLAAPEEFEEILEIYNRYPICELIIHPRIRTDYYEGRPRMEFFQMGLSESRCPVCYNGDIKKAGDVSAILAAMEPARREKLKAVMIGRGAVASPWIFEELAETGALSGEKEAPDTGAGDENLSGAKTASAAGADRRFWEFHDRLVDGYGEILSGERNVLFKMKELWFYFGCHFPEGKKELKRIKKTQKVWEYREAVAALRESGLFDGAGEEKGI